MPSELAPPAVESVLAALDGQHLTTYAVADRGDVVAVVVQNDETRHVVLVEKRDTEWVVPTTTSGSRRTATTPRAKKTESHQTLQQLAITTSGWPDADGGPPEFAWCAVTGIAAHDARDVLVTTEIDEHTVPIGVDGFVLAVVRARRQEMPSIAVRTSDNRQVAEHGP